MELRRLGDTGLARAIIEARFALVGLAALTVLRLAVAASVPLVPDEAYYWVWSRALASGYPDHPPMVALWIRIGTALAGDTTLGVRLLGPMSMAIASLLLWDAADRLLPDRQAGLRAASLMNATLLVGVGGLLMTPDAPLLILWIACLWSIARLIDHGDARWWLIVGLFAGLAMDSKYTAALLWIGIAFWLLVSPSLRRQLRRPWPWFGAMLGLVVFLPVVLWEAGHGWASFTRQGGRLYEWRPTQAVRFLMELLGGQIGLITPLVFALCVAGVAKATWQAWRTRDPVWTLLAALTVPSVALFTQHALGDRVQGNWPAVIYPAATIAASGLQTPVWRKLWTPALALGFAMTLAVYLQASQGLLPLAVRDDPIARQLAGWDTLANEVDAIRRRSDAEFVTADQYGLTAMLAWTLPWNVTVVGAEQRWSLIDLPRHSLAGHVGILVHSARRGSSLDSAPWSNVTPLATAARRRGNETVEEYILYRVVVPADGADVAVLPRPG